MKIIKAVAWSAFTVATIIAGILLVMALGLGTAHADLVGSKTFEEHQQYCEAASHTIYEIAIGRDAGHTEAQSLAALNEAFWSYPALLQMLKRENYLIYISNIPASQARDAFLSGCIRGG